MALASEKRILVVDDEPDVRNFLSACIEDAGFNVETAVDGVDALEKIKENMPDLMTLDMVMPRKSGINLMRTLRNNDEWGKIPVIVITAHAKDELGSDDIKEFVGFAAHHRPRYVMEKPITPARLVETIGEILEVEADVDEMKKATFGERNELKKMIDNTDPETLSRLRELLKK